MSQRSAGSGRSQDLDLIFGGGSVVGLDDGSLLDRVVLGDAPGAEAAFEALIRRHGSMVARVCGAILGDSHAADDATQAVFVVLARRAGSIRNPDRLAPWLHGVALRTAREARTRAARRQRLERTHTPLEGATMIDTRLDPAQSLIRREQAELLHGAIARLPSRYLAPVVLCDLEGLTHAEAAARLDCPVSTVSIRLKRAKEKLRAKLARHHLDFEAAIGPAVATLPRSLAATTAAQILANRVAWATSTAKWKAAMVAALVAGVAAVGAQGNQDSPPVNPILPQGEASQPQNLPAAKPVDPPQPQKEEAAKVEVGLPIVRGVANFERFQGRIVASRTVEIRPHVGGIILSTDVVEGDLVQKGQTLFEIDNGNSTIQAQDIKARLAVAVNKLDWIKSSADRPGDLYERKLREEIDALKERLLGTKPAAVPIVAPFAGQVARRLVDVGATVEAGKPLMATIIAVDPIQVDFEVDKNSFFKIQRWFRSKSGMTHLPVKVAIFDQPDFSYPGRVLFRATEFVTRSDKSTVCTLHAEIPNADHSLIPGLSAWVRVEYGDPRPMVLIPATAWVSGVRPPNQTDEDSLPDNNTCVLVVDDDGSVRQKWIKTGELVDGLYQVIRGIDSKTRIVLRGGETLRRGDSFAKPVEAPVK